MFRDTPSSGRARWRSFSEQQDQLAVTGKAATPSRRRTGQYTRKHRKIAALDAIYGSMTDLMTQVAAPPRADAIRSAIRERAGGLGFDAVGFAAPDLPRERQTAYRRYIA